LIGAIRQPAYGSQRSTRRRLLTLPRQTRPPEGLFAERLDHLFRTVHPKDRGPWTPADVAEAINAESDERVVSGTYLWLLRTGQRDNPTMKHIIAIARFFGVPPTYFFPDDSMRQDAVPAELAAALSDDKVREMALRAAGLSDRSLKAITDMIDSARTVEGLPDDASPTG
jgi:transcriptional regulator with XRE-family HTH domain